MDITYLEEYFKSNVYGDIYYKRVLFHGFVTWFQYSPSAKHWDRVNGMSDSAFPCLKPIKKSEAFIELL